MSTYPGGGGQINVPAGGKPPKQLPARQRIYRTIIKTVTRAAPKGKRR